MNKDLGLRGVNLIRNRYTVDQKNSDKHRRIGLMDFIGVKNKDTSLRQLKQMNKLKDSVFSFFKPTLINILVKYRKKERSKMFVFSLSPASKKRYNM